jgi:hypothetical protein
MGEFTNYLGTDDIIIELPEKANLRLLLDYIEKYLKEKIPDYLWNYEERRFRGSVVLLVNNQVANQDTLLKDGQKICIFKGFMGG